MVKPIYKLDLEEKDQDFKTLYVQEGTIIHIEPIQEGWVWCGKKLTETDFAPGDPLILKDGARLNYCVRDVSQITASMSYKDWLEELDQCAHAALGETGYTRATGAKTKSDPWISMYLDELSPADALAEELHSMET